MTKREFDKIFKNEVLPQVKKNELNTIDKPARRQAYNNSVDFYTKDGILTQKQFNNFIIPNNFLTK